MRFYTGSLDFHIFFYYLVPSKQATRNFKLVMIDV